MTELYELFTNAGVEASAASWGVVIITAICVYALFKTFSNLFE